MSESIEVEELKQLRVLIDRKQRQIEALKKLLRDVYFKAEQEIEKIEAIQ